MAIVFKPPGPAEVAYFKRLMEDMPGLDAIRKRCGTPFDEDRTGGPGDYRPQPVKD